MSNADDALEIQANLSQWSYSVDAQDWSLVAAAFVANAAVDYDTLPVFPRGFPDFVETLKAVFANLSATQHLIGNVSIQVDGDTGRCSSYVHATHVGNDGRRFVSAGRYDDDVVRTDEGWRISARQFRRHWGVDPDGLGADLGIGKLAPK